ncbi:uncharacterized protein F4822DRAFT_432309 [Hypoxylon trugodes]|uniref:uncharacterized protein n=1 Tax=Hypoxylon trugodes TaxID=326681 RepID=UPI002195F486|nr:uncharacterized protein F4822DRAFT_432309 [Hypoxylon trugodes]KAI1385456.1 hypothetical protein F4822DRAFT_432309 [Hypoxylon trugodes]
MAYTYHLDVQRHTFRADELSIRPVAPADATGSYSLELTPILYADIHKGRLALRHQQTDTGSEIAAAKFPTSSAEMEIKLAGHRTKLKHSFVQVDAYGRSYEKVKPERSFWRNRIKDGSRGCYVGVLPDGARIRWEPAGPKDDMDSVKKSKGQTKMRPKLRCMLVDKRGASVELLGEMMQSNDVMRLMRGGELQGEGGMLGVYVLLGFVSLFERARARNKKRAELELEVDFTFDGDGGGGDGGDGGGDGGGGDGGGGGGGS